MHTSQEYDRGSPNLGPFTTRAPVSEVASERTRWETYMAPFEAAVRAGVGAVMCSYNRVNGSADNVGAATNLASGAVLTLNADGTFSYDPNGAFEALAAGETATDTFTYSIVDLGNQGATATATVTFTISTAAIAARGDNWRWRRLGPQLLDRQQRRHRDDDECLCQHQHRWSAADDGYGRGLHGR